MAGLLGGTGGGSGGSSGHSAAGGCGSPACLVQQRRPGHTGSSGGEKAAPRVLAASVCGALAGDVLCDGAGQPLRLPFGSSTAHRPCSPTQLLMDGLAQPALLAPPQAQGRLLERATALAALQASRNVELTRLGDGACWGPEVPQEQPTPEIADARHSRDSATAGADLVLPGGSGSFTPGSGTAAGGASDRRAPTTPAGTAAPGPGGQGGSSSGSSSGSSAHRPRKGSVSGRQFASINRVASVAGQEYVTRRSWKRQRRWSEARRWRQQREASGHPTAGSATSAPRVTTTVGLPPGWPARQQLQTRSHSQGGQRQPKGVPRQLSQAATPPSAHRLSAASLLTAAEAALQAGLGDSMHHVATWVAASAAAASGGAGPLGPDAAAQLLPCTSAAGMQGSGGGDPQSTAIVTTVGQAGSCRALKPVHGRNPCCFPCNPISALARLLGG